MALVTTAVSNNARYQHAHNFLFVFS